MTDEEIITLDYGSGGRKTARLIEQKILPKLDNEALRTLGDGAVLPGDAKLAFSTDSFVVDPLFFPGGDIGKLAVCGTVNDLAMCGAEPKYLSCALIIEEGLPMAVLDRVLQSMAQAAEAAGVQIVTGDTKVVDRGRGDKLYINTSGIGFLRKELPGPNVIRPGDAVLVSGTVGDHGTAVMLARSGMMEGEIRSDCAALNRLTAAMLESGAKIRVLRDPTRGGLATTLNEFTEGRGFGIELREDAIPVRPEVRSACDLLGLEPLYCANEGKLTAVCAAEDAEALLERMRALPEGKDAAIIGTVTEEAAGRVVMRTGLGGRRILQKLAGAQLPRIC
ncbi:MAG: hydrogenase expression/formation protein HypE [Oscillospiraceae bacterium]|nr:hydrogenase expression/formation protein HypE [Oscillospiraceae bacterium]